MDIQFFGHNCFVVGNRHTQILIDPWLTPNGAFYGSWFQWPINHHLLPKLMEKVREKPTWIYISHEHQDHFDIETLATLRQICPQALIPDYYDKYLRNTLQSLGYLVTELRDGIEHPVQRGLSVRLLIVDTGVNHDSAALITADGELFINQNDCKIFDRLAAIRGKVNYYAVQFSGATWHPVCYTYSDATKREISRKKVNSKLIAIKNVIRQLKPEYYMPSAGPAIFPHLAPDLSLGIDNIFVHQPILKQLLQREDTRLICLRPGETFHPDIPTDPINPPEVAEIAQLGQELPNAWKSVKFELRPTLLIQALQSRLDEIEDLVFETCPALVLDWGPLGSVDGLLVDLNSRLVRPTNSLPTDNFMHVRAEPKYFALMSHKEHRWQDVYLSMRAEVTRSPDLFNTFVNIFLFSDAGNIRKAFQTTLNISEERILRVDPMTGKNYEINRYCPHNGADLIDAEIDGEGNLVCPRHSWKYSLSDRGNCHETGASIKALEVETTITLCETISARITKVNRVGRINPSP